MAHAGEGTAYIPMEDWLEFLQKYMPGLGHAEFVVGPPRLEDGRIVTDFAWSDDDSHPADWATTPKAVRQESLSKKHADELRDA